MKQNKTVPPSRIVNRSILHAECMEVFRAAIRSPSTRDVYERRLISFLKWIDMTPDCFIDMSKKDPCFVERKIISFICIPNPRLETGEITSDTISNSLKTIRLLLEMNDVSSLNWKKIRRVLPRARICSR
jgi:hypothetical protein